MYCIDPACPDFEETGRPGEYVDGITTCPVCGATLVAELPAELAVDPMEELPEGAVEPVFETDDPSESEVVRSILSGAGIPFVLQGHDALEAFRAGHAAYRFHPLGGAMRFVVPADRAEEARALLTEVEETPGADLD